MGIEIQNPKPVKTWDTDTDGGPLPTLCEHQSKVRNALMNPAKIGSRLRNNSPLHTFCRYTQGNSIEFITIP